MVIFSLAQNQSWHLKPWLGSTAWTAEMDMKLSEMFSQESLGEAPGDAANYISICRFNFHSNQKFHKKKCKPYSPEKLQKIN